MLTIGATMLFYLLPWLPQNARLHGSNGTWPFIRTSASCLGALAKPLLDAGLRAGLYDAFRVP